MEKWFHVVQQSLTSQLYLWEMHLKLHLQIHHFHMESCFYSTCSEDSPPNPCRGHFKLKETECLFLLQITQNHLYPERRVKKFPCSAIKRDTN